MRMPEFLFGRSPRHQLEASFLLGETGFSFPRAARPAAPLDGWMQGVLPEAAREFARARSGMPVDGETLGLPVPRSRRIGRDRIRVAAATRGPGPVVDRGARRARLRAGAACARTGARAVARGARRYRASAAIVFVQETPADEAPRHPDALRLAFGSDATRLPIRLHAGTPEGRPFHLGSAASLPAAPGQ